MLAKTRKEEEEWSTKREQLLIQARKELEEKHEAHEKEMQEQNAKREEKLLENEFKRPKLQTEMQ